MDAPERDLTHSEPIVGARYQPIGQIALNDLPKRLDELVDRVADGAFLRDLAKETGIDKRRLSERLRKHPDYSSAKESATEVQLDDAQLAISLSREPADIARAREMFRAAAWRAEHEFPDRWGKRPDIAININNLVQIDASLGNEAASLLDQLRTVAEIPKAEPESVQIPDKLE